MDKIKINKVVDALCLSVDNKNILKEILNKADGADITEIETKVDTINKELNTAKADISNLGIKVSEFTLAKPTEYTLPAATKTTLGGVKAITNIVNVDTETATVASLAGVINTLLNQLRAAGIIRL